MKATDELAEFSNEFTQLLKTVQTRGDYAAECWRSKMPTRWRDSSATSPVTSG